MTITVRSFFHTTLFPVVILFLYACGEKPVADACCTFSGLNHAGIKTDQGAIQVQGSTTAHFYVFDENGTQIGYQHLNKMVLLDPGTYKVKVNNTTHAVEVTPGNLAKCSTGTLIVNGQTSDYYYVIDSLNKELTSHTLGKATSLFPSALKVKVNNTELPVDVKLNQITEIQTGSLVVQGGTNEYYYVLDDLNKQLNFKSLGKPLSFLPGSYMVKVNNTSMVADVAPGKLTELGTGTLLVRGLTNEYYYVLDTSGNSLNFQTLNKPLSFFPGTLKVTVNNTVAVAKIVAGEVSEYATGSLMLTGAGTGYYYVLDDAGNQLNFNTLNKSLSFFPSEYVVRLGESYREATVISGERTSIPAFNDSDKTASTP